MCVSEMRSALQSDANAMVRCYAERSAPGRGAAPVRGPAGTGGCRCSACGHTGPGPTCGKGGGEQRCGRGWVGRPSWWVGGSAVGGRLPAVAGGEHRATAVCAGASKSLPATFHECSARVPKGFQPLRARHAGSHGELYRKGRSLCHPIVGILSIFVLLLLLRVPLLLP